jgi:hypothetical protein
LKIIAISASNAAEVLLESQSRGYITFMYEHADPTHQLLTDKFLYVSTDGELVEKINLLQSDMTAQYSIR